MPEKKRLSRNFVSEIKTNKALSSGIRLHIMKVLAKAEQKGLRTNEVADLVNISPATASKSLTTLHEAGLIRNEVSYQAGSGIESRFWLTDYGQQRWESLNSMVAPKQRA